MNMVSYVCAPCQKSLRAGKKVFSVEWNGQASDLSFHTKRVIILIALLRFSGRNEGKISALKEGVVNELALSLHNDMRWEDIMNTPANNVPNVGGEIIIEDGEGCRELAPYVMRINSRNEAVWHVQTSNPMQSSIFIRMVDNLVNAFIRNDKPFMLSSHLSDDIKHAMLFDNNEYLPPTHQGTWVDRFVAIAKDAPDSIALVIGSKAFTYETLYFRASSIAHHLRSKGLRKGDVVGVLLARGVHWATSLLGIMLAGCVYVPFDKTHPQSRRQAMASQAMIRFMLTDSDNIDIEGVVPLNVHTIQTGRYVFNHSIHRNDPAYMLFTSGTTGVPKGAVVHHAGMLNHLKGKIADLSLTENDVIAQNAGQCFDISIWQLVCAWCIGAKTVLYPQVLVLDAERLIRYTAAKHVTLLEVVPSYLEVILDMEKQQDKQFLNRLRYLMVTGERVTPGQFNRWLEAYPNVPVVNAYGPTEASDDITHYISSEPQSGNVPLGYALPHCRVYILDRDLQPVPRGVLGEICVGGIAVGLGYKNRPKETRSAFFEDPHAQDEYTRLYRTGDVGWMDELGLVHMIGRRDEQVKVNGNRVELSDIERAISVTPDVEMVAVIMSCNRLVGFYTGKAGIESVMRNLRLTLPGAVVPSKVINLAKMPLSHNGKIDKKALEKEMNND